MALVFVWQTRNAEIDVARSGFILEPPHLYKRRCFEENLTGDEKFSRTNIVPLRTTGDAWHICLAGSPPEPPIMYGRGQGYKMEVGGAHGGASSPIGVAVALEGSGLGLRIDVEYALALYLDESGASWTERSPHSARLVIRSTGLRRRERTSRLSRAPILTLLARVSSPGGSPLKNLRAET